MSSITIDIANYHFIGLTNEEIRGLLKRKHGAEFTLNQIQGIIYDKSEYIKRLSNEKVEKVAKHIANKNSQSSIIEILRYKGANPKDNVVREVVAKATNSLMRDKAVELASKIIGETDRGHIVRYLNKRFKLDITLSELLWQLKDNEKSPGEESLLGDFFMPKSWN